MTQTVRFVSRYLNADQKMSDIVCRVASALMPPPLRQIGAGGDVQYSPQSTVIFLCEVEPESMAALQKEVWTHVHWSSTPGELGRLIQVRQIIVEGDDVRVLV